MAALTEEQIAAAAANTHDGRLIHSIMTAILPKFLELEQKVAALQSRITELEVSSLKYVGAFQLAVSYRRGDVVSFEGTIWHACRATTAERPGGSDSGWQLMAKSHGRD